MTNVEQGVFRKKPVSIRAFRVVYGVTQLERLNRFLRMCGVENTALVYRLSDNARTVEGLEVRTLEGVMAMPDEGWLIVGVSGEAYPCRGDIFERTYEYIGPIDRYGEI